MPVIFATRDWTKANDLYVLTREPAAWSGTLLDARDSFGTNPIAGRDSLGRVQLGYVGSTGRRVVGVPGSWDLHAPLPMSHAVYNRPFAFAFGAGGQIHAIFDANPLEYAFFDGCSWSSVQTVDVASAGAAGVAVDAAGNPHIAYSKSPAGTSSGVELWYAHLAP